MRVEVIFLKPFGAQTHKVIAEVVGLSNDSFLTLEVVRSFLCAMTPNKHSLQFADIFFGLVKTHAGVGRV